MERLCPEAIYKCPRDLITFLSDRGEVLGSLDPKLRQKRENTGMCECGDP